MTVLQSFALAVLALFPVTAIEAAAARGITVNVETSAAITLERTACKADCPVYRLSVTRNGTVSFQGISNVEHKGNASGRITPAAVKQLLAYARKIGFFGMKARYLTQADGCVVLDEGMSSAVVTINLGKQQKTIRHYLGCQGLKEAEQLDRLENYIDNTVDSRRWVGKVYEGED